MNTSVLLIRHGDLVYPLNDRGQRMLYGAEVPLSEKGRNQIVVLSQRLKKEGRHIDSIYTSPYLRAVESADILAHVLGIQDVIPVDDFRDIDNSAAMGMTMDEVLARKDDFGSDSRVESLQHLAARMLEALQEIVTKEENHTVAVVSHGDAIRSLLFRLEHPQEEIPSMSVLSMYDYLDKGEAWRLVLTPTLEVVDREYIGRPLEQYGRGERKS